MGFLERRADQGRQTVPAEDRYGSKPGPRAGGSNEPLYDARRANQDPVTLPRKVGRTDLAMLLGRTVLEARVQQICQEYGLIPRTGPAVGSGLSRSYLARAAGVEIAADTHGMVTTVFLHFHGDDGFTSFQGEIPGGAGSVPRRRNIWAMLGRPDETGDPYRDRFLGDYGPWDRWLLAGFVLHAQFAPDGESLHRVTLSLPDRLPRAA
jgi:hypothetical protein